MFLLKTNRFEENRQYLIQGCPAEISDLDGHLKKRKNWRGSDHVAKPENILQYPTNHLKNKFLFAHIFQQA
jgi:hypothetical protein